MPPVQDGDAAQPASATLPVEIAGRYQAIEPLGSGGYGIVYKAWDRALRRTVAIKAVRLEALVTLGVHRDEVLRRFEREATTAAGLTHPGIVTIYDVGTWRGAPYLAMEFVEGVSLDRLLASEGRLPAERSALIALEVAEALEYAHGRGVLHRDVKPQNVMVPHQRSAPVKLVDFGLAKAMDCTDHLTRTGTFLGTPSYASPEQITGQAVDGRSDVWAVGCVLYEMLTGEKAFGGAGITSVMLKIMTVEPPPVRDLDPGLPEDLARIVRKAMAKAPEERHASAADLAAELRHFVRSQRAGQAALEPTVVAGAREEPEEPMQPTLIASATELGAEAARSVAAVASPAPVPAPRPRRGSRLTALGLGLGALAVVAAGLVAVRWYTTTARPTPAPPAAVVETLPTPVAEVSVQPAMPEPPPLPSPSPPAAAGPAPASPAAEVAVPVPSVQPSEGTARISSNPSGARVSVDGHVAGRTPLTWALPPGRHRIAVEEQGREPWAASVSIKPGRVTPVHASLRALPEPSAADPNRVYAEGEVDVRPQRLSLSLPPHPDRLLPPHKKGGTVSVTLSLVVGADGAVSDVKVERSSGIAAVDEAVAKALPAARYRPGTKDGVPVRTRVNFVFSFRGA